MTDFIILGTDTDAGKTTFALLWLHLFGDAWEYWKPIESGESDSARIVALCPIATVHPPLCRFRAAVAPPLAARMEGSTVPAAREIKDFVPRALNGDRGLVIETFGSPFSPLNESELQLALIRDLDRPCVLVSSSRLGAIGRTLQTLRALRSEGIAPIAVVLLGDADPYAEEQIRKHGCSLVIGLPMPRDWTPPALRSMAESHRESFVRLRQALSPSPPNGLANLLAEDRRCVWHPYTPLIGADEPMACVGAQDEFLELADGRQIIDGISSWWTILHGHRDPRLMKALAEASHRIDHVLFAGVTHPYAVELAGLLLGTMPWRDGRVFYSDNGSTAVEVALKMAYQFWCHHGEPQRTRFVGFEHGYHGDTFGAMSVGRDPLFFGRFEPLMFRAERLPLDPVRLDEDLQRHGNQTAAVILEPLVQGAGGMCMHSPQTLAEIAEVTHRHGVLFIADEVMTGCYRTGTLWAHQAAGIVPDLMCAAKTLAGGVLSLAATLVSPKVVKAFQTADRSRTFFHGHSFTAHPLACAVAVSNMRRLLEEPPTAPCRMEAFWRSSLEPLRRHSAIKDVRVRGSIAAVEIHAEGGYLADIGRRMYHACLERGVLLRPLGNVLYAMPPYCTSDEALQRIADAMRHAVDSLGRRQKT